MEYNRDRLWEPDEMVPELVYTEIQATTEQVQAEVDRIYVL
jgi:hypothetical protein